MELENKIKLPKFLQNLGNNLPHALNYAARLMAQKVNKMALQVNKTAKYSLLYDFLKIQNTKTGADIHRHIPALYQTNAYGC